MNKEELKNATAVMQAALDGREIQIKKRSQATWANYPNAAHQCIWDWATYEHRVKPIHRVVTWTAKTFPKDRPVWVRNKECLDGSEVQVHCICDAGAFFSCDIETDRAHQVYCNKHSVSWDALLSFYEQHDGSPCGIVEGDQ